jgi:hypothetical protein
VVVTGKRAFETCTRLYRWDKSGQQFTKGTRTVPRGKQVKEKELCLLILDACVLSASDFTV